MSEEEGYISRIITAKAEIILLKGNTVKIVISDNVHLETEDIIEIHRCKLRLISNLPHTVLLVSGRNSSISQEARELSASPEISKNRLAKAIVVRSLAQRLIGNFFISRQKTSCKVRLFDDAGDAMRWLSEFRT